MNISFQFTERYHAIRLQRVSVKKVVYKAIEKHY